MSRALIASVATTLALTTSSLPESTLAQTFTAQFAGDPQHTGRSAARGPRRTPQIRWRFRVKRRIYSSPISTQDGTIVFAGLDGMVHAMNASGVEQWARFLEGAVFATPAQSFGLTILGHGAGWTALDSRGNIRWHIDSTETADASPLLVGTMAYLAVRGVTAVDARDGTQRWSVVTPRLLAAPSANHAATAVIVGDVEGNVRWLAATDGHPLRVVATGSQIDTSVLVLDDDSVVVGSEDGHLRRITEAGVTLWNVALGGEIHSTPALAQDGSILVGTDDFRLYAVDPSNGAPRWNVRTGNFIRSSPRVDRDGWIYLGSEDDSVYAIEPTGRVAWSVMLGADVDSSPHLISDGQMYIGCDDGGLYSLHD